MPFNVVNVTIHDNMPFCGIGPCYEFSLVLISFRIASKLFGVIILGNGSKYDVYLNITKYIFTVPNSPVVKLEECAL